MNFSERPTVCLELGTVGTVFCFAEEDITGENFYWPITTNHCINQIHHNSGFKTGSHRHDLVEPSNFKRNFMKEKLQSCFNLSEVSDYPLEQCLWEFKIVPAWACPNLTYFYTLATLRTWLCAWVICSCTQTFHARASSQHSHSQTGQPEPAPNILIVRQDSQSQLPTFS